MKTANKKVLNATTVSVNGIEFKSKLEGGCYKMMLDNELDPQYETMKFVIMEGFKPKRIKYYTKNKLKPKEIVLDDRKIKDMTYTPDFVINRNNKTYLIEAKGNQNDVYPYKRKLFLKLLENITDKDFVFVEIFNLRQMSDTITKIKENTI